MKKIWHIARIIIGLVFIFSGFVKGIDPLGSAYKFTDYFQAWNIDQLSFMALPGGILLSFLEFITGISLLTRVFIRFFSKLAVIFMVFFTILTFVIALTNPVTDCGCFGDAVKLTNWHTFIKNLILLPLSLIAARYIPETHNRSLVTSIFRAIWGGLLVVFIFCIYYSYNHLPLIDFRPFKTGVNIPEAMTVPKDAPKAIYKNSFVYKNLKTGKLKKFTEANYPWKDSLNWKFISMDSKLIQKGAVAPIHNFSIETLDGENVSDFFLNDSHLTFFLISPALSTANWSNLDAIKKLSNFALKHQMNFIGLTASLPEEIIQFRQAHQLSFDFFNTDEITLKTMIRSNPGLMVIKNGTILKKWHFNDIPSPESIEKLNRQQTTKVH